MRAVSDYLRNLRQAHLYLFWFAMTLIIFRRPFRFLKHYVQRTAPQDHMVELRDGTIIKLSGHPHDIITLFVIWVRRDYGRVIPKSVVVDIGANLGAFAIYAARSGARVVHAYEPNSLTFNCLKRNIETNSLSSKISPRQLAVSAIAGKDVRFPRSPSAYNQIATEGAPTADSDEFEVVQTTSLTEILANDTCENIDLLKLDCEGAEYDILLNATPAHMARIREVRMEFHLGREEELKAHFLKSGFEITRFRRDSPCSGTLWARRGP